MAELYRYAAFISYSSKDARFAQRLHRALESYGIPSSLGSFDLIGGGGKRNRIYPVFRDREELSAGQLGDQIEASLRASAALIVVCSPHGAASPWVQKEIEFFAALGRHAKVFAIIPDTAPLADEQGADCTQACFPPAFRGDALAGDKLEPLAADARKGKDGFRNAWLKIVAGMIGVTPGQIIDRDRARQLGRALQLGGGSILAIALIAYGVANVFALSTRSQFSRAAVELTASGHVLDALPFAIAGVSGRGDGLFLQQASGNSALAGIGGTRILEDLGNLGAVRGFLLTRDGATLVAVSARTPSTVADLRHGTRFTVPIYESTYELSADGGVLLVEQLGGGSARIYDLHTGAGLTVDGLQGYPARFSLAPNGAWLLAQRPDGRGLLVDVAHQGRLTDLGDLGARSDISGDGTYLVTMEEGGRASITNIADNQRVDLGIIQKFELGPRRDYLIVRRPSGDGDFYDFNDGLRRVPLHGLSEYFSVPAEGTVLQTERAVYDLASGRSLDVAPGACRSFAYGQCPLLGGGAAFVTRDSTGLVTIHRLRGSGASTPLGSFSNTAVSENGAVIAVSLGPSVSVFEFGDTLRRTDLGEIGGDFRLSPDGETLIVPKQDRSVTIHRWRDGAPGIEVANVRSAVFSDNGAVLVIQHLDYTARWYDLREGVEPLPLGNIGDEWRLSPDGAGLIVSGAQHGPPEEVTRPRQNAVLYNLRSGVRTELGQIPEYAWGRELHSSGVFPVYTSDHNGSAYSLTETAWSGRRPGGAQLSAAVCAINADVVRPFSPVTRSEPQGGSVSRSESEQAIQDLRAYLRGRPWNPCDWRGLFAIFPDASRGDGWFEGVRQWWRLVQVRHFGAADWACPETISAASQATTARRVAMCSIVATSAEPDRIND